MVDYSKYLYLSGFLAAFLGIALLSLAVYSESDQYRKRPLAFAGMALSTAALMLVMFSGMGLAIYAVINGIYNAVALGPVAFLEAESKNGMLGLRISAVLLFNAEGRHLVYDSVFPEDLRWMSIRKEKYAITKVYHGEEGGRIDEIVVCHLFFYKTAIILAWYLTVSVHNAILLGLLNWAILFIVDDFLIISRYFLLNGGRVLLTDARKVIALNGIIAGCLSAALLLYFPPAVAATLMVLIWGLVLWPPFRFWRVIDIETDKTAEGGKQQP